MTDPTIRLLIADDHPVVRAGIVGLIAIEPDMAVVAQADNGQAAIEAFERVRPDVTLMDLQMPALNGLEAIARIRRTDPMARILVLSTHGGDMQVVRALRAGACGYLLKTMIRAEMINAIRSAHASVDAMPLDLARHDGQELSAREVEVLRLVADSGRNKRVATELGLSEGTVKVHMKNILAKLDASDRVQAVVIALRRGIIELD